jgi:hypothetical protein
MDSEGCPYLDNGRGCNNQGGARYLVMDIPVDPLYPAGKSDTATKNHVFVMTFRLFQHQACIL